MRRQPIVIFIDACCDFCPSRLTLSRGNETTVSVADESSGVGRPHGCQVLSTSKMIGNECVLKCVVHYSDKTHVHAIVSVHTTVSSQDAIIIHASLSLTSLRDMMTSLSHYEPVACQCPNSIKLKPLRIPLLTRHTLLCVHYRPIFWKDLQIC